MSFHIGSSSLLSNVCRSQVVELEAVLAWINFRFGLYYHSDSFTAITFRHSTTWATFINLVLPLPIAIFIIAAHWGPKKGNYLLVDSFKAGITFAWGILVLSLIFHFPLKGSWGRLNCLPFALAAVNWVLAVRCCRKSGRNGRKRPLHQLWQSRIFIFSVRQKEIYSSYAIHCLSVQHIDLILALAE